MRGLLCSYDRVRRTSAHALAEFGRVYTMAAETERADVVEVALAAPFGDGYDVVGVPERFAGAAPEAPVVEQALAIGSA